MSSHLLSKTLNMKNMKSSLIQVSENKVLRKIFGPKKDEVSEQFGMLH
jgi:hypothetical protein